MAIEDERHLLVEVNTQFCRALRARPEELLGIDFAQLIPAPTRMPSAGGQFDPIDDRPDDPAQARVHVLHRGDGTVGRFWLRKEPSAGPRGETRTLWSLIEVPELSHAPDDQDGSGALQQSDLLDALPAPIAVLDEARSIIGANPAFLEAFGDRVRLGDTLACLGQGWMPLDDDLARLTRSEGTTRCTLELPLADGPPVPTHVDASVLTAADGTRRMVVALSDAHRTAPDAPRLQRDGVRQARADTCLRIADDLAGLAGMVHIGAWRRPPATRALMNSASRIMTFSLLYTWEARTPGRLPLDRIVAAIVATQAHLHSLEIPFTRIPPEADGDAGPVPYLTEKDALLVSLAIDELVSNAIAHRLRGSQVSARLFMTSEYAIFHVRNAGDVPPEMGQDDFDPDTAGLGLIKALLPASARVMLLRTGADVLASLMLQRPLLRYAPPAAVA